MLHSLKKIVEMILEEKEKIIGHNIRLFIKHL